MSRVPFVCFFDCWDALWLASALDGAPVATFGGPRQRDAFGRAGIEAVLVEPDAELQTTKLLACERVAERLRGGSWLLLCFKPSVRLERAAAELGAEVALARAVLAQGIENKLSLAGIAAEAGVVVPPQAALLPASVSWDEAASRLGDDLVVQPPRGFAGRRTWRARSAGQWQDIARDLGRRPARVARFVHGRPGTVNAVVDRDGSVLVTAPIVQVTGEPRLTPFRLGSCGNDFSWRPSPHPEQTAETLAERIGPVLARRGYRGHFGLDFVFDGTECVLIEINARLTASFALYSSWEPRLLHAHVAAVRGERIDPLRLPPLPGGQLIATNATDSDLPPPTGDGLLPHPGDTVAPGGRLARVTTRGTVVDGDGAVSATLLDAVALPASPGTPAARPSSG